MLSIGPVYTNTEGLIWVTTPGDTDVLNHIAQPALPDLKWVRTYSEYSKETILTPQDLTYVNVTKHQVSGILESAMLAHVHKTDGGSLPAGCALHLAHTLRLLPEIMTAPEHGRCSGMSKHRKVRACQ